jgi:hypothetical protein
MRPVRTLALAGASAVLLMSQAISALACEEHKTAALTAPARSATAKFHSLSIGKPAIRSWPIVLELPALPSRRWGLWGCTMSRVIW